VDKLTLLTLLHLTKSQPPTVTSYATMAQCQHSIIVSRLWSAEDDSQILPIKLVGNWRRLNVCLLLQITLKSFVISRCLRVIYSKIAFFN